MNKKLKKQFGNLFHVKKTAPPPTGREALRKNLDILPTRYLLGVDPGAPEGDMTIVSGHHRLRQYREIMATAEALDAALVNFHGETATERQARKRNMYQMLYGGPLVMADFASLEQRAISLDSMSQVVDRDAPLLADYLDLRRPTGRSVPQEAFDSIRELARQFRVPDRGLFPPRRNTANETSTRRGMENLVLRASTPREEFPIATFNMEMGADAVRRTADMLVSITANAEPLRQGLARFDESVRNLQSRGRGLRFAPFDPNATIRFLDLEGTLENVSRESWGRLFMGIESPFVQTRRRTETHNCPPAPHADYGKIIARPSRTFSGSRVEYFVQADGSTGARTIAPVEDEQPIQRRRLWQIRFQPLK